MTRVRVSDHALVRFLERAGGLDVEGLRAHLAASLEAAAAAAGRVGAGARSVRVCVDGLAYTLEPERGARAGRFVLVTVRTDAQRRGKGG